MAKFNTLPVGDFAHVLGMPETTLRRDLGMAAAGSSRELVPGKSYKAVADKLGMHPRTAANLMTFGVDKIGRPRPKLMRKKEALQELGVDANFFTRKMQPRYAAKGSISGTRLYWPDELRGYRDSVDIKALPLALVSSLSDTIERESKARSRTGESKYHRLGDCLAETSSRGEHVRYNSGLARGFFVRDGRRAMIGDGRDLRAHTPKGRSALYLRLGSETDKRLSAKLPREFIGVRKELKPAHGKSAIGWIRHWLANDPGQDWTYNLLATALHNTWYSDISVMTLNKRVREMLADADDITRDPNTGLISLAYQDENIDSIL